MKEIIKPLVLAGILTLVVIVLYGSVVNAPSVDDTQPVSVTNFDECVVAGNPVMESYPRQCRSAEGVLFVEEITLPPTEEPPVVSGCAPAGCSGQLCVEASEADDIVTTCEFRAEYACYQSARCERQTSGQCGWTMTSELQACLANPPALE